jgi:hypothetical protein
MYRIGMLEIMRTTLELDDDVVDAAKEMARDSGSTLGQVISDLARRSLNSILNPKMRNGVPLLAPVASRRRPDLALVNSLRDQ